MPKYPTQPIYNGAVPADQVGRRSLLVNLVGTPSGKQVLDLSQNAQDGSMPFVQSVYIDTTDFAASNQRLKMFNRQTGQRVQIMGNNMGYFPLVCGDQLIWDVELPPNYKCTLIFLNVEIIANLPGVF